MPNAPKDITLRWAVAEMAAAAEADGQFEMNGLVQAKNRLLDQMLPALLSLPTLDVRQSGQFPRDQVRPSALLSPMQPYLQVDLSPH
tara:strand:- start:293 stop:553 length:261 start_codon:yes stop_codon:yes gene_type:complete